MTKEEIDFFNRISTEWDSKETVSLPPVINHILDIVGLNDGDDVLDLGTGTGILVPYILRRIGKSGKLKAIDASPGMINVAQKKYNCLTDYDIFELKDFELENISEKYDVIFCYCVYPHLNNPLDTLKKLSEHNLKDNGRIIIAFPKDEKFVNNIHKERKAPGQQLPMAKDLAAYLNSHGFHAESVSNPMGAYVVIITK